MNINLLWSYNRDYVTPRYTDALLRYVRPRGARFIYLLHHRTSMRAERKTILYCMLHEGIANKCFTNNTDKPINYVVRGIVLKDERPVLVCETSHNQRTVYLSLTDSVHDVLAPQALSKSLARLVFDT